MKELYGAMPLEAIPKERKETALEISKLIEK
jgi:hypothetical protein